ncbi:putative transcription factor C16C4.22 [Cucurbita pepo subsp. pepo]|uniref:putative transcription factor C16C4.22 n=1 Tax=Cucurbita pepo subsp. pepo TaxID=3664 RepID=UPI000C9D6432|nr:putative transcription factor C16C4.22 [Cucurbita pepo subsp. pepo]
MAEKESGEAIRPEFPMGRIKKIMKLDKDIGKVNSEALFLVSCATELFLELLAEKSSEVAAEKKRKTVKLEHIRIAVKRHQSISDFLLDSLPLPSQPSDAPAKDENRTRVVVDKVAPEGTRRIDDFFRRPAKTASAEINET